MRRFISAEDGHIGPNVASLLGIAAAVVAAIGIRNDSDTMQIIGVALFGAAIIGATQVPHLWIKKIYRRIDRAADADDPDRHEGFRWEV